MIQRGIYLACSALLIYASCLSEAAAQGAGSHPPAGQPIQIYLTALAREGSAATLNQSELSATIDKQPVQVTSLRSAKEDKILFALLVDISTSETSHAESIKKSAMSIFQGLSTDGNQGYLVEFCQEAYMSKVSMPPSEVQKALEQTRFVGGTALFDAIWDTTSKILSRSKNPDFPRRVIILISDGDDNQSHVYSSEAEKLAIQEGVAIFSLNVNPGHGRGETFLIDVSNNTGGRAFVDGDWQDDITALLKAINSQWVLSLAPQQSPDQKFHPLHVQTKQPHVSISAPAKVFLH